MSHLEAHRLPYPFSDWHAYQGQTNDCGPFSVAIAANAIRQETVFNPEALSRSLAQWRGWLPPDRVPGWIVFPWGLVRVLREQGFGARWRVLNREERLWRNLHADLTTIVVVGRPLRFKGWRWAGWSHYKVLHAWDPERGWGFADPAVSRAPGLSWQDEATFRREWTWMGRQLIEVWDSEDR
ncbi:MAG: hypothetical protein ACP5GX_00515 [Anaerolineae bacterium]